MINSYLGYIIIKSSCKKFMNTKLYEYLPFTQLASLLNNKDLLELTNTFLKLFIMNDNIHTRKFLTCFMIKHHPNVIISDNTDIEKDMLTCSKKLLDSIEGICYSRNKFSCNYYISRLKLYYSKYIILFDRWKDYDKYRILNDLSTIYFELEQDKLKKYDEIDSLSNHEFIVSIEREQKKLVEKIERIAGKEGLEYIHTLKKEINNYKKNIENLYISINENLHDSFWHSFNTEISKNPPNLSVIIARLSELKDMFISCDNTLKNELDSNIDVPFIDEMLGRGVIDDTYIYNMCNYIVNLLKRCNSEMKDDELDEYKKKMNEEFSKGILFRDFFPKFFRYVFESIDDIQKHKEIMNTIRDNINNL